MIKRIECLGNDLMVKGIECLGNDLTKITEIDCLGNDPTTITEIECLGNDPTTITETECLSNDPTIKGKSCFGQDLMKRETKCFDDDLQITETKYFGFHLWVTQMEWNVLDLPFSFGKRELNIRVDLLHDWIFWSNYCTPQGRLLDQNPKSQYHDDGLDNIFLREWWSLGHRNQFHCQMCAFDQLWQWSGERASQIQSPEQDCDGAWDGIKFVRQALHDWNSGLKKVSWRIFKEWVNQTSKNQDKINSGILRLVMTSQTNTYLDDSLLERVKLGSKIWLDGCDLKWFHLSSFKHKTYKAKTKFVHCDED